ncbi:hypothetical protein PCK2_000858 [Pneumocystis canis]|nr:hypothetical protein PCK2_000858 [Pneumocystis canis]
MDSFYYDIFQRTSAATYLWFLSIQKLSPTVITPEIADKIISACLKISFPSITISQEKMNVLIRIMNQRPQIFIRRAPDWILILHSCLVDTCRPIREKALQSALYIEKALRGESKIGLAIINNMKEKFQEKLMIDVFFERFQEIIKEDGDESVKPWREDRLMDHSYVEPSEIPTIDPKWIRSNVSVLESAIETLLTCTMISKDIKLSVWRNFNKSISFAGNKEIKISFEAMDAVTKLCELLKRFWFLPTQQNQSMEKEEYTNHFKETIFATLDSSTSPPLKSFSHPEIS